AKALVTFGMAIYTVTVQNACMSCEAREYGRSGILRSPLQNFGQTRPIWFQAQIGTFGLCTRHNQRVETAVPEVVKFRVKVAKMPHPAITARYAGYGEQLHHDRQVS